MTVLVRTGLCVIAVSLVTMAALFLVTPWVLDEKIIEQKINPNITTRNHGDEEYNEEYKVPNIVHYIWYNKESVDFPFHKVLSVLSAVKHIKPDAVYFHTDTPPKGKYFEMLKNISIFKIIHREPPKHVLNKIKFETDYSDFDKVKVIMETGGIYLDFDVMVVKSFDPLRKFNCTLGLESSNKLCSGVIVCVKDHPFLYLWLNSYYEDFKLQWSYNSGIVSTRLMRRYDGLIHVEENTLHRPNCGQLDQIWGNSSYPWRNNYAVHTWIRFAKDTIKANISPEYIKTMNSTYGQIAREVFYGSPALILK